MLPHLNHVLNTISYKKNCRYVLDSQIEENIYTIFVTILIAWD
jgi:hypothetical protein